MRAVAGRVELGKAVGSAVVVVEGTVETATLEAEEEITLA